MTGKEVVRVDGADNLRAGLKATSYALDHDDEPRREIGEAIADEADPPFLTGATAASVRPGLASDGAVVTAGGPNLRYVPIVHAHNPWLNEAADRTDWFGIYERYVERQLDKIRGA